MRPCSNALSSSWAPNASCPTHRECHLYELLRASETVGRALTNQFYALYADIRQRVLTRLCRENAAIAPPEILRCTQKLLDRVLFCAFCE